MNAHDLAPEVDGLSSRVERILVIDDEEAIVTMLAQILRRSGYEVETATNALTALDSATQRVVPFDLILTDVNMPQLSGAEFARQLLARDALANIIFMSGVNDDELQSVFADEKSLRFLQKPFSMAQLLDFVATALH